MASDETYIVPEINPFASPTADAAVVDESGYRIQGNKLEVRTPVKLPPICIHCGDDAHPGRSFARTIYYTPPWIFLLLLAGPIFVVIGSMLVRKPVKIDYALCPGCNGRRKQKIAFVSLVWLALLGCLVGAIAWESAVLGGVCFLLFLTGIVGLILCGEHFKATRHTDGVFQLSGAKASFLEHPIVHRNSLDYVDAL
ncbi:hypothetical protein Enr8_02700 [Blastopirellula retiformator]|uniref:LITAF domain-containing protein n=2 Tax=Blastopirellula retiformator TaxID=2527970 RepID=A0A5C5VKT8_9BACT|nr:hypothetical protein Enr8_02700 [Blastopirellula retiformator]